METFARRDAQTFCSWRILLYAALIIVGLGWGAVGIFAQSGAGSIQGTVTDSTGAVIPGASIHVVNNATSVAADTKSNDVGFYQVPSLFTGTYTVNFTAPGMKTYKATVELLVDQRAVVNPVMTAGAVTQEVQVSADLVQLTTTENGTIASTLENSRINQLPMNGRNLLTLAGMTTPGLEASGQRANGLMPEALEYVADGASLSNRNFGGVEAGQVQLPDPDAVQEVRLETVNTGAQYTEPGTTVITTKSGTNALHGAFFETARNNAIGVAKSRSNPYNYAAPHLVRNEFGASVGGPIVVPGVYHGKDKSFWFFAYERYSLAQIVDTTISVPSTAMRGGDFSGLVNSSGVLQQLYDPNTTYNETSNCNGSGQPNPYCRLPLTNNQISLSRRSSLAKTLYDIIPQPTNSDDPLVQGNFISPGVSYTVIPTVTFRFDHTFDEKNRAYLRYTDDLQINNAMRSAGATPITLAADGLPGSAIGVQAAPTAIFSFALGYTHVFSPTFFSETVLSNQWFNQNITAGGNPLYDYESALGLPNNFGEKGFPNISTGLGYANNGTMFNYQEAQIISTLDENLTKTVGKNQMQFGGRYRHERFGYLPDRLADSESVSGYATALYNTGSGANYTNVANTGYGEADTFLGAFSSYGVTQEPPYCHYHDMEFDGYFQDNYHMSRKLTVNIGLRYEAHPAAWTKYGLTPGFDFANDAQVLTNPISYYIQNGYTTQAIVTNLENLGMKFETASQAGFPNKMLKDYLLTLGPRVGFAWQPLSSGHGLIVRGAYGRYIYPVPVRNSIRNTASALPFVASYGQNYNSASQSPDGLPNYVLRSGLTSAANPTTGVPIVGVNATGVVNSSTTTSILPGQSVTNLQPDYAPDYVTQTNFTLEQPLKGNSAVRLTWLWAHGTNLDHYHYYNNAPSTYVWEMDYGIAPPNGGASVIGTPQQNTYAATATRPYDNTKYGQSTLFSKDGWSNDNALQATYQRLFHSGIAYQINYVWSKPFRFGGNYFRDGNTYPAANFVGVLGSAGTMTSPFGTVVAPSQPPARPSGVAAWQEYHALDKYEYYYVDTAIPKQHITFNGIYDLPFGHGKRFLPGANRAVDELVGGWQLAGDGNILSQDFQLSGGNWGPNNPIKYYKHGAPITDCRSGTCYKSYLWFNGYIAPSAIQGNACATTTKTISGLPSDYVPYQTPIDTTCGTANYGTNNVQVTAPNLNGGAPVTVGYSPGPTGNNRYSKTFLNGPINWTADLSVFKVFPITEKTTLRFNMDAFNVFNEQGFNNPNTTDGTEAYQPNGVASSYNTPRQVQFTLRFTF